MKRQHWLRLRRANHSKNPSNGYGKQKILQRMLAEHGNLQKDEAEEIKETEEIQETEDGEEGE